MIQCQLENGHVYYLRHVVVDAITIKNNKILLVKRALHLTQGGKYALPGGILDRDETTSQAVLRELLEETGYQGKIINLFMINDNPNRHDAHFPDQKDRQNVAFIFLVEPVKQMQEHDNEATEVKWFDINNLLPKDQFAFDHFENIQLYLQHLKKPFKLPIFNL